MDEDDDCYGFGSYFTLFNGVSGSSDKDNKCTSSATMNSVVSESLNTVAISQYVVQDSALRRLYEHRAADVHHHVLAKFNRALIGSGFGDFFLYASTENRSDSLVYRQKINSDSDKRQQIHEILMASRSFDDRDASNTIEDYYLLLAFSLEDIEIVKPAAINESVHGACFQLKSGHILECFFMPGPLYRASSRDEVIDTIQKTQKVLAFAQHTTSADASVDFTCESSDLKSEGDTSNQELICARDQSDVTESFEVPDYSSQELDDDCRDLIRQYLDLDADTEEAMRLADQIHKKTGYSIGPTKTSYPDFSTDPEHRQSILQWLSTTVDEMTKSWTAADLVRERETNAKCVAKGTKKLCYIDTISGEEISVEDYRDRYLKSCERITINQDIFTCQVDLDKTKTFVPLTPFILPKESSIIDKEFVQSFHADLSKANDISEYISFTDDEQKRKAIQHFKPVLSDAFETAHRSWMDSLRHIARINPEAGAVASQESTSNADDAHVCSIRQQKQKKRRLSIGNQIILPEASLILGDIAGTKQEASAASSVQEQPRICELCCDNTVSVCMMPCRHEVCQTCWYRLSDADDVNLRDSRSKICPWDREMVRYEPFTRKERIMRI